MTNPHPVRFHTDVYTRSHGKQPRGFGQWAFAFGVGHEGVWFAPTATTLTDAKRLATAEARRRAVEAKWPAGAAVAVDVMP
jgi:hypothetical protein